MSNPSSPTANRATANSPTPSGDWQPTACILCECNCGIEVQLGGEDGRRLTRIRGDKQHPASEGYACEKPSRLDFYQNGPDRVTAPLRRRPDGTFEEIDWDTAIREVAERLGALRAAHGGESIFYYGGGGQGNHLPGAYSRATLSTLGVVYRSNALAQEKTGEFWVNGKMIGSAVRGDFEHCEVGIFLGKNPWHSHGFPRARVTLREMAKDPKRLLVVVDPRRSETAEIADVHLQVKPGTDAWLLAALIGVLVQEDLVDHAWLAEHAVGMEEVLPFFHDVDVQQFCEISGVAEEQVRTVARRVAGASSVAMFEDLGTQMNVHSTLVSYLHRLVWSLTGHFGKRGAMYSPTALQALAGGGSGIMSGAKKSRTSPVVGARIITGLVPCNVIAEEILTDHPKRYRAMIVESGNPAHSLADSPRMREALRSLDTLVVIDVAMTETARLADYVLPVATQFEKPEATFFNFDFPKNVFHLRHPLLEAPEGVLTEAEIHSRLVEALGAMPEVAVARLREAAGQGLSAFAATFFGLMAEEPGLFAIAPVLLYRSLGPTLPEPLRAAAVLWGSAQLCVQQYADAVRRAGIEGEGLELGNRLFEAILASPHGLVFTVDPFEESLARIRTPGGKIQLAVPELFGDLQGLGTKVPPMRDPEFPFVLSAGERRSFTANTIFRDPRWRKKDAEGALRISPDDAKGLGVSDQGRVRLTTRRGSVELPIEISDRMQPGHVSIPNGMGLTSASASGEPAQAGVAPNDLTTSTDRDPYAGTPWHKHVAARVEAVTTRV